MMPLTISQIGETNSIKRINGKDEIRKHLEDLGFVAGESITVVSKFAGSMIIQVKESRIALDKSLANRIMV